MLRNTLSVAVVAILVLAGATTQAQQFEIVHSINFESTPGAKAALDSLFADTDMKGAKASLYVADLGAGPSSHLVVVDFDKYQDYVKRNQKRRDSHGWAKYQLATQDSEYLGGDMFMVVDDHGESRHTAAYLVAYLIRSSDAALYREAVKELHDGIGDPGVMRLVARRSGGRDFTHAVLIGGDDFVAVNNYIDKLNASKAYKDFVAKVGDTREVIGLQMYRRVASWGY